MAGTLRILVAHATAAGSTREIAERIADRLRAELPAGAEVVVAGAAPELDVAGFDAYVVGSAVHEMAWLPAGTELLQRARTMLGDRPLWCFSVGGIGPRGRLRRSITRMEAERVQRGFPSGVVPREHRVFAGVVALDGLPLWARLLWSAVGGRAGDHRDWAGIDAWADGIAAELRRLAPVSPGHTSPPAGAR